VSALVSAPSGSAPDVATAGQRRRVAQVADNVLELMRSFNRVKARVLAAAERDVEWSAHLLLRNLQSEGPKRASELAECVHVDPSTVSRQVAALVRGGLLERQADPADGRASLLVLTDMAHAVLADHARLRLDSFADMLHDWSEDDLEHFAVLLARFTAAYDRTSSEWPPRHLSARPETQNPESED
jgi:DNA-binding MarR family transcriptional regulator